MNRKPTFNGIRALVFDFDGTLIDASIPICRSFNIALERFGRAPLGHAEIQRLIGRPLKDMFAHIDPNFAVDDIQLLIDYYREAFMPIACSLSRPMPGLQPMLAHFDPHMQMAIATSRISDGAYRILESMQLLHFFPVVIGLEDVTHPKPHPEPVRKALAAMNIPSEAAIMVGDVPADMESAKAAGAYAIGIVSLLHSGAMLQAAGADAVITSLKDLIDLIEVPAAR